MILSMPILEVSEKSAAKALCVFEQSLNENVEGIDLARVRLFWSWSRLSYTVVLSFRARNCEKVLELERKYDPSSDETMLESLLIGLVYAYCENFTGRFYSYEAWKTLLFECDKLGIEF